MSPEQLNALQNTLTPLLMPIEGVAGVSVSGRNIQVYLENDSDALITAVKAIVERYAPDAPVDWVVSGPFRAL